MINYFEVVFCKLYHWSKKLNTDNTPQYTALSMYSVLLCLNAIAAFGYGWYFVNGASVNLYSKMYALLLFIGVIVALYLYFIHNRKYIEMYKAYIKSTSNKQISSILTIMYIVVSILLFIGLIWLP